MPVLARNKKAFHDYFIEDKLEAGIELVGTEVKSVKAGKVSIKESFIRIIRDEVFVMNMHTKQRLVKMEIGLAKGKKMHDKRESLKRKDIERDMKKVQKNFGKFSR